MKYYGGCDVGSTYTKAVILDETGKMVANTTIRSKVNSEQSAIMAMDEVVSQVPELHSSKDLAYQMCIRDRHILDIPGHKICTNSNRIVQ